MPKPEYFEASKAPLNFFYDIEVLVTHFCGANMLFEYIWRTTERLIPRGVGGLVG